jgi:hypothetical protein
LCAGVVGRSAPSHSQAVPLPAPRSRAEVGAIGTRWHAAGVTSLESEILRELVRLDETVADMAAGRAGSVLPVTRRLDELARLLPSEADPQLVHYLRKHSYGKARLFLEGNGEGEPTAPGGHCEGPRG